MISVQSIDFSFYCHFIITSILAEVAGVARGMNKKYDVKHFI